MTTKTNITLPPLPGALVDVETEARAYARAAVEADRKGRMPSDEELLKVCESAGFLFHYDRYVPGSGYGLQAKAYTLENFRALLSRYSSGQPATQPAAVEADRRGRMPSDEEILALAESARVWVPMGSGPEKDRSLQALRSLITTALSRYSGGKPASCDCDDKSQCWEPCGDLGHDAEHAKLSSGQPAASAKPLKKSEFRKAVEAMRGKPVAPVAQEPVAEVLSSRKGNDTSTIDKALPDGTKLYAWPVAAQAQPTMPPLTEAMRAVLRNEHCVYDSEDALYAALCDAAQAQSSGNPGELDAQDREDALSPAARDVLSERRRQVDTEGWTPEHDDAHADGALALAAACYAAAADPGLGQADAPSVWPWAPEWWKPTDTRRNLVKAGALILAEIERLDRAAARAAKGADHG